MERQELIRALSALPAATHHEGMGKVGAIHHTIQPLRTGFRLAGIAYTIRILSRETLAGCKTNGLAQHALAAAIKQRTKEESRDAHIKAGEPLTRVLGLC